MSRDFWQFFLLKKLDLGPIRTGKNGFTNFFVFAKIWAKNECLRSQCLRLNTGNYFTLEKVKKLQKKQKWNLIFPCSRWLRWHCASIFVDYADTVSCICWGHDVGIVLCRYFNDYVDTFCKLCRLFTDFEGTITQQKCIWACLHIRKQ